MKRNKLVVLGLSGLLAVGMLGGAAAGFAQAGETAAATAAPGVQVSSLVFVHNGGRGELSGGEQALADALGIELSELDAAEEVARLAMIDQAVADGLITEAQATQLKELGGGFGRGFAGYDREEYLAEALGITVEALEAAELTALETELAAAVEAGTITQEEADLMLARKAAQNYLDEDALNAAVLAAYGDALDAAVAAGDITQAQADALLAELQTQSFNFGFRGFGGRGGHGGRGHHGPNGFGLDVMPDTTPETTPDTTTGTSFDA